MSPWLKAGLIGAGVLVLINLLGLIPYLGCLALPLTLIAYLGVGVLAASYQPAPRQAGPAAGQGALAALVAGIIGGLVSWALTLIQAALGGTAQAFSQLPPELMRQMQQLQADTGMSPEMLAGAGALVGGGLCCSVGVLIAVALGAIGGAVYAALKPE